MKTKMIKVELPTKYRMRVVPESIKFDIPCFKTGNSMTLALRKRDCKQWYNEFADRVINACGRHFLPVCRMSDGEFLFLLGEQPSDFRLSLYERLRQKVTRYKEKLVLRGGLGPRTIGHYHSGEYSANEWKEARTKLPSKVRDISAGGILALHLNYTNIPFQEAYFPALEKWLIENNIILNDENYYPFYFVYAMLTGPRRGELLKNRRVLVVNGAQGEKKQKIIEGLKREGVSEVFWCPISLMRSLYDTVDINPFIGKVDLAFVGAGIGKFNIFSQLEPLNVPCIDAGFVFEIWADPKNKWERPLCASADDCEEFYKRK